MTNYNIYALQTARKDSKSVPNKNILLVDGKPLYKWNLEYAKACPLIKSTFISTNIPDIINNEMRVIERPKHMCRDNSSHYETILHGLFNIEDRIKDKVDILVILLGNNKGAYTNDLEIGIQKLLNYSIYDSCISVGCYNMFNPYRAYKIVKEGCNKLQTYVDQDKYPNINNLNDKNAYGNTYFFNGSFWICRREVLINNNGIKPFTWIGNNICPIIQNSEIMELDAEWQIKIL